MHNSEIATSNFAQTPYKVSVIVPVYKVETWIEKCARSLFEQTLESLQYIFVDDCSPDGSIDVLKKVLEDYQERKRHVIILRNEKNLGLASSRNKGMEEAKGEYVIHCDSDDWVDANAYKQAYALAKRADADVVMFGFKYVYKKGCISEIPICYPTTEDYFRASIAGVMHNSLCNKLFRSSLFTENDIRWVDGVNMLEDSSVTPRLMYYAKSVACLKDCFYYYNQQNMSSYTHYITPQSAENILQVTEILEKFLIEHDALTRYHTDFFYFKIHTKLILLLRSSYNNRIKYGSLYPEAKPFIWSHPQMFFAHKLLVWLASAGWTTTVALLVPLLNTIIKLYKESIVYRKMKMHPLS